MAEEITFAQPIGVVTMPGAGAVAVRGFSVDLDDPEQTIIVTLRGANGVVRRAVWSAADANLQTRLNQLNKGNFSGANDSLKTALAKVVVADGKIEPGGVAS